ncbi:diaminopimelate epimerase [Sediminicoccus rosea]|uniref:Diaminopimelate epimerase n=1 Tax=Sediminicoccus rosea TaxID=1225128 RepID=A0ABZ0PK53_9PROT|nr:diaminopimelate epimerase [Sediminicoccus rosea]WPB86115.1 diaminopimelate epimerase [Sediminicoccus rosea]
MQVPFLKMHGLGNDFVVLDARAEPRALAAETIRWVGDRHRGVGFDQLITLEPAQDADVFFRFHNSDGSEAGACGNGTRCAASLILNETGRSSIAIRTIAGLLGAERLPDGTVRVDMGPPRLGWADVPLAREMDTLHVPMAADGVSDAACCSMGNPHANFFVEELSALDVFRIGPELEHHPLLPERANIGFVQVLARDHIRLVVWERGAGYTLACGSGACAALVNARRRGLVEARCTVTLPGGDLVIEQRADGHVLMSGPVATSFKGELTLG